MKHVMILAATVILMGALAVSVQAQTSVDQYFGGGYTSNVYSDPLSRPGPVAPNDWNRQSLNSQPYDYSSSGFGNGATYCCDFSDTYEQQERNATQDWQLHNTYSTQKPLACGPAMSPRAREGC